MNTDTQYYKEKLEIEKKEIEASLQNIAVRKDSMGMWENADTDKGDSTPSDRAETAESITEYETNASVVSALDQRLIEIETALSNISEGKYGMCSICGMKIENDRLEANPAAQTCKSHLNG